METAIPNALLVVGVLAIVPLMYLLSIIFGGGGTRSYPVLDMHQTLVELTKEYYPTLEPCPLASDSPAPRRKSIRSTAEGDAANKESEVL